MTKGTAVNITGSIYGRKPRTPSNKRKASTAHYTGQTGVKRARITGSGDYKLSDGNTRHYTPFGSVGQKVGSYFGAPGIGWAGGHLLGRIMGSGDYMIGPGPVQNNTLVNTREVPAFHNSGVSNVVCHREYIGDIITSATPGAFKVQEHEINPGNDSVFPWLSSIAENYEEYKIHGMVFQFKSMSADALNSTNTSLGSVIMATSYNPNSPNFTSKQQMENYEFSMSAKPSQGMMHGVECAQAQTPVSQLYVRTGAVPSDQDQRWFDLGKFQIATSGMQGASVNVGELWVTYQIEFFKPKIPPTIGGEVSTVRLLRSSADAANPYGSGFFNNYGNISTLVSGQLLRLRNLNAKALYQVTGSYSGGVAVAYTAPTFTLTNALSLNVWNNNATPIVQAPQPALGGTTAAMWSIVIEVTAQGDVDIVGTGTTPPTASFVNIIVTQLDSTVLTAF